MREGCTWREGTPPPGWVRCHLLGTSSAKAQGDRRARGSAFTGVLGMRSQGRAVKLFPPPLCASPTHTPVLLGVGCEEQVGLLWSLFLAKGRGPPGHVRVRDTLPTEPRAWSQLRLCYIEASDPTHCQRVTQGSWTQRDRRLRGRAAAAIFRGTFASPDPSMARRGGDAPQGLPENIHRSQEVCWDGQEAAQPRGFAVPLHGPSRWLFLATGDGQILL